MYKAIVLIKRAEGVTPEQFRQWFLEVHAPNAVRVGAGRIRRYTASFVIAPGPRTHFAGGAPPFEIVSELWCDDRATLDAVYADLARSGSELDNVMRHVSERTSVIAEEIDLLI